MKHRKPDQKRMRGVRMSDSMWAAVKRAAYKKEMRPSEYIRRIVERFLEDAAVEGK